MDGAGGGCPPPGLGQCGVKEESVNLSIMQNKFPSIWKFSKVLPLHKKEDPLERKNYRPVALTSHIVKVFEKVVRKVLVNQLEVNNLFQMASMASEPSGQPSHSS